MVTIVLSVPQESTLKIVKEIKKKDFSKFLFLNTDFSFTILN